MASAVPPIMVVSGSTASGKSALAMALAQKVNGWVINADSKQVYQELRILSARPTEEEEAAVAHTLYGYVRGDTAYSAGAWMRDCLQKIRQAQAVGATPILTGGSGLYLQALLYGLVEIPPVSEAIQQDTRQHYARHGLAWLQQQVQTTDPELWKKTDPQNPMRLLRALEVFRQTGKPLSQWQAETPPPSLSSQQVRCVFLLPQRDWLYRRINKRFEQMLNEGVEAEIQSLLTHGYPTDSPVMKAHGVPEFIRYFAGQANKQETFERVQQVTRHYAKRQVTWYRHQWASSPLPWHSLDPCQQSQETMLQYLLTLANAPADNP